MTAPAAVSDAADAGAPALLPPLLLDGLNEWLLWLEDDLIAACLRALVVTEEAVRRRFAEDRLRHDRVEGARIVVPTRGAAEEMRAQVEEDGEDFGTLTRRHTREASRRTVGGYLGVIGREHLSPESEAAVFGAVVPPAWFSRCSWDP